MTVPASSATAATEPSASVRQQQDLPPVVMEFTVPRGSRLNAVSTPPALFAYRPGGPWWKNVSPSSIRSGTSYEEGHGAGATQVSGVRAAV